LLHCVSVTAVTHTAPLQHPPQLSGLHPASLAVPVSMRELSTDELSTDELSTEELSTKELSTTLESPLPPSLPLPDELLEPEDEPLEEPEPDELPEPLPLPPPDEDPLDPPDPELLPEDEPLELSEPLLEDWRPVSAAASTAMLESRGMEASPAKFPLSPAPPVAHAMPVITGITRASRLRRTGRS
jgi:hypothetical protein